MHESVHLFRQIISLLNHFLGKPNIEGGCGRLQISIKGITLTTL